MGCFASTRLCAITFLGLMVVGNFALIDASAVTVNFRVSPNTLFIDRPNTGSSVAGQNGSEFVAFGPDGVPTDYGDVVIIPRTFTIEQEESLRNVEFCREVRIAQWSPSKPYEDSNRAGNTVRVSRIGDDFDAALDPNDLFAANDIFLNDFHQHDSGLHVTYFYGARLVESRDRLGFSITHSNRNWSAGDMLSDTRVNSLWAGPTAGVAASLTVGRLELGSRFGSTFAYNDRRYRQYVTFAGTQPGQVNAPLSFPNATYSHASDGDSFAYVGELRLSASYWLSNNSRLGAVWSNTYLSAVYASYNQVQHGITHHGAMGFRPENGQDLWLDSLQLSLIVTR